MELQAYGVFTERVQRSWECMPGAHHLCLRRRAHSLCFGVPMGSLACSNAYCMHAGGGGGGGREGVTKDQKIFLTNSRLSWLFGTADKDVITMIYLRPATGLGDSVKEYCGK